MGVGSFGTLTMLPRPQRPGRGWHTMAVWSLCPQVCSQVHFDTYVVWLNLMPACLVYNPLGDCEAGVTEHNSRVSLQCERNGLQAGKEESRKECFSVSGFCLPSVCPTTQVHKSTRVHNSLNLETEQSQILLGSCLYWVFGYSDSKITNMTPIGTHWL